MSSSKQAYNYFCVSIGTGACVCPSDQNHPPPLSSLCVPCRQMRFLLLFSRQGKLRLQKWYTPMSDREKKKIIRDMTTAVLARQPRTCNFLHWKDLKIIYKRWAGPCILSLQPLANATAPVSYLLFDAYSDFIIGHLTD